MPIDGDNNEISHALPNVREDRLVDKPAFLVRTLYKAGAHRTRRGEAQLKRFALHAPLPETKRKFKSLVSFAASLYLIKFIRRPSTTLAD